MTNARLTVDEAKAFFDANPGVQWIDAFLFDMNGIPRGKRIRRSDLLGVARSGLMTPDLLGGPDSQMIANVIERQFKRANDWPFGAALSFLLMYATFAAIALRAYFSRGKSATEHGI
jgi:hypothetical protein